MIKNDTAKDFAYLTSQEYNRLYGGALIDDETVCFINDKGTIYTHNHEFGAGKSYSAGDYIKITNNAIGVNFNELTAALRNAGFGTGSGPSSGNGVTYTAGRGINISNNVISAKMSDIKSDLNLGLNDLTNVTFPSSVHDGDVLKYSSQYNKWINGTDNASESSTSPQNIRVKTEAWFKNSTTRPVSPTISNYQEQGWNRINQNLNAGEDTWMVIITFQDNIAVSISDPVNVTNGTGSVGSDTDFIEFIYHLYGSLQLEDSLDRITEDINQNYSSLSTSYWQQADYRPSDWTDQPTGISSDPDEKYEYATYRLKVNGSWGEFKKPYVLSAYGDKGIDGDGVEYIFCCTETAIPPSGNADPSEWTNDYGFQDPEYKRDGSIWEDDPIDMSTMSQGTYQWVSKRKYDGTIQAWKPYSKPALWSYNAKDGVAGGYTWRLINEVMAVGTGDDNVLDHYEGSTGAQVFYNGSSINNYRIKWNDTTNGGSTGIITGAYRTDGLSFTSQNVKFEVRNNEDYKIIHVDINDLQNFAGSSLICPVDIEVINTNDNSVTQTLHTALTIVGLHAGADGQSIDLKTNCDVIHTDYRGMNPTPNHIDAWVLLGTTVIKPSSEDPRFYFGYGTMENVVSRLNYDSIYYNGGENSKFIFYLYYRDSDEYVSGDEIPGDARLIDYKTISIIKDGAPAIGPSRYTIEFIEGSLDITESVWTYSFGFKTYKDNIEITENAPDEEYVEVHILGDDSPSLEYDYNEERWVAGSSVSNPDQKFAIAYIREPGGTVVASLVIPIVKDGDSADPVQGLQGTVMRFTNFDGSNFNQSLFNSTTFYDGETPNQEGIKYLDIVNIDGDYYYPLHTGTGSNLGNPSTSNNNWAVFNKMSDAAFDQMIARNAYIKNLTSQQIVITKGSGQNTEVVAGMANGEYLTPSGNSYGLNDDNGVRIWAGNITNGNVASAPFTVDENGHLKAEDAELSGKLIVSTDEGRIENGYINYQGPQQNAKHYPVIILSDSNDSPMFSVGGPAIDIIHANNAILSDGSGRLANGNIRWDSDGNLYVKNINLEENTTFSTNLPTITNNGSQVDISSKYSISPTIIADQGDTIVLPNNVPDGTAFNIFVKSTGTESTVDEIVNSVKVECGTDGSRMNVYYSGSWHTYAERDTYCQVVGMYFFVKKGNFWYGMFPY